MHRGRWSEHPDHRGTSFVPEQPFLPGERGTVRLGRSVNGADGEEVRFSVAGVARAGPGPPAQPVKGPLRNVQRFGSRPDLRPPAVEVSTPAKGVRHGVMFVAPKMSPSQRGPMIVDPSGELVWFHPLAGTAQAFDFRAQAYDGNRC